MKKLSLYILLVLFSFSSLAQHNEEPYLLILGTAQDGGYPHMGCKKKCCTMAWADMSLRKNVVALALVCPAEKKWWLFEATPDIKEQLHYFQELTKGVYNYLPDGIFITHAHIGHYTGLMELGREVMGTKDLPVYVLPRMKAYLESNGPWSQLVTLHNITLHELKYDRGAAGIDYETMLPGGITIGTYKVPHRDEYSETGAFEIYTRKKTYFFVPDLDKWEKCDPHVIMRIRESDIALVDGTFFSSDELPGRNMSEVPHPFISETMATFNKDKKGKTQICFIHFNHTNPLLWDADKQKEVKKKGYLIARQGEKL